MIREFILSIVIKANPSDVSSTAYSEHAKRSKVGKVREQLKGKPLLASVKRTISVKEPGIAVGTGQVCASPAADVRTKMLNVSVRYSKAVGF